MIGESRFLRGKRPRLVCLPVSLNPALLFLFRDICSRHSRKEFAPAKAEPHPFLLYLTK